MAIRFQQVHNYFHFGMYSLSLNLQTKLSAVVKLRTGKNMVVLNPAQPMMLKFPNCVFFMCGLFFQRA